MKYRLIYTFLFLSTTWFFSCDRPNCNNENLIFKTKEPDSKMYKDELVKQLNTVDMEKLTYWLQKYNQHKGNESLYFHIQGDGLCAILHLSMNHWNKMESVRHKKILNTWLKVGDFATGGLCESKNQSKSILFRCFQLIKLP